MARFGRGQPHGPLYLRAPLIAAVVAAATVSPIHVVQAEARPRTATHVVYLRPSRSSFVPDRLAPQVHVVSLVPQRALRLGREASITQLRTAAAAVAAPQLPPPAIHVVGQRGARRDGAVVQLRTVVAPAVVAQPAPQIHVVGVADARALRPRPVMVRYVRPSRSSLVPDRIPQRIRVVSLVGARQRVMREPLVALLHGFRPPSLALDEPLEVEDRSTMRYLLLLRSEDRYVIVQETSGPILMMDEASTMTLGPADRGAPLLDHPADLADGDFFADGLRLAGLERE